MTLHWWMHWFWITYQICVCTCDTTAKLLTMNQTNTSTVNTSDKKIGNSYFIPPMTGNPNLTSFNPIKLHKAPKKHDSSANLTNKALITTEYPLVKETTVIDQNLTDTAFNTTTDSLNTTSNILNHLGNLTTTGESSNQSAVINSELIEAENENPNGSSLSAAGITGITLGCVSIIGVICTVSFIMYRNYGFNRPQVLNDRCSNPDSSGYIDDSTVRENSEEMYSLDNDSFLNSLEAMTIQNLWTDTVKHTKL